jgi:hypothetical protein
MQAAYSREAIGVRRQEKAAERRGAMRVGGLSRGALMGAGALSTTPT